MDRVRQALGVAGLQHLPLEFWWRYRRKFDYRTAWNAQHRAFFIHIPKTAGTSIYNSLNMTPVPYTHAPARIVKSLYPDEFRDYFTFTVVRDPWDRFVSTFEFLKSGTVWPQQQQWAVRNIGDQSFHQFVTRLDREPVYRAGILAYNFFFSQSYFINDGVGRPLVERVYRFESLQSAFAELSHRFSVAQTLSHSRASGRTRAFHDYYDSASWRIVGDLYAKDVVNFGYD